MKNILAGIALLGATTLGFSQERFDIEYQRIRTDGEKKVLEFFERNRASPQETVAVYLPNKDTVIDINYHRLIGTVFTDWDKLDSLVVGEDNIQLFHSHTMNGWMVEDFTPKKYKKNVKELSFKELNNRLLLNRPSTADYYELYRAMKRYPDIQVSAGLYVKWSNDLYTFGYKDDKLLPDSLVEEQLKKYSDFYEAYHETHCEVFDKLGSKLEPDVNDFVDFINERSGLYFYDINTVIEEKDTLTALEKQVNNYFSEYDEERVLFIDVNRDKIVDITTGHMKKFDGKYMIQAVYYGWETLDSLLNTTDHAIIAHNHTPPITPLSFIPSYDDIDFYHYQGPDSIVRYQMYQQGRNPHMIEWTYPENRTDIVEKYKEKIDTMVQNLQGRKEKEFYKVLEESGITFKVKKIE